VVHRYAVTVGGKARAVEIEDLGAGAFRVVVDGRERRIDARQVEPGVWSLVDEATARAACAQIDGTLPNLVVEIDGIQVPVEIEDARSRGLAALAHRTAGAGGGAAILRSPMPGRVVRIACRVGDVVTSAQGLVVVEAMKMENELRAPRDGTVREIRCQEGAAVESGQDLIVIG